ncbi:MAG: class I SAM-dependent methyltransferase [Caldimonas sp.]
MIDLLRRYVRSQQFNPGLFGAFLNPFFLARRQLWREIAAASPSLSGPLLDVGCGTKPYRDLFDTDVYVGLEIDSVAARTRGVADAFYEGDRFPFQNAEFRSVLCNQVLEHVFRPERFIGEIRRVLASGGTLLLTVPFVWDEHEQPYDYARYSSFGLKALLEQHGFRVLRHRKLLADFSVIFQLVNAYLFKTMRTRSTTLNLLVTAFVLGPVSLLGLALGAMLPKNPDLYLDQLVVAERL